MPDGMLVVNLNNIFSKIQKKIALKSKFQNNYLIVRCQTWKGTTIVQFFIFYCQWVGGGETINTLYIGCHKY
jgi:hypothetical protein